MLFLTGPTQQGYENILANVRFSILSCWEQYMVVLQMTWVLNFRSVRKPTNIKTVLESLKSPMIWDK